ncbi:ADP-ribosylglycohydrolase family protein [Frigoriglobus tundricola]|uniref:Hydrolase n=1 Tax=Frigoriglobus tundricola TaxID=2774151 RepID=A0A6M5YS17_9BACT|nr:ADP-ribosylglycohydrolase family protein [Frigoriglobus tundricola]QJW96214.1 Putative hydrolase [Frigoriglobus tundricola]
MNTLPNDHAARTARAALALDGLSVGDALGETCFRTHNWEAIQEDPHATTRGPWPFTDDTAMALGIYETLAECGGIDQDRLALRFAARYTAQPWRGYGAGAHRLLEQIGSGTDWRYAAERVFPGGSYGNGSAMRVAPLAGYFAESDYAEVAHQARLSAGVTHAHPEGLAGAVATAVAGAYAWKNRDARGDTATKRGLFDAVLAHTPPSDVRRGIERAATFSFDLSAEPHVRLLDYNFATRPFDVSIEPVVRLLGNGSRISCQDTVPFCLWVAALHLDDYRTAIVQTIRAAGDIDTNCAIVGGIVALATGRAGIPADWLTDREELVV